MSSSNNLRTVRPEQHRSPHHKRTTTTTHSLARKLRARLNRAMATPQLSISTETTSVDPPASTDTSANNSKVASPNSPPPYWSHVRNPSLLSQLSIDGRSGPIRLQDNTEDTESSKACWAKAARVDDYVVITGNAPGLNDYIVWNCTIDTLNVCIQRFARTARDFDCRYLK